MEYNSFIMTMLCQKFNIGVKSRQIIDINGNKYKIL